MTKTLQSGSWCFLVLPIGGFACSACAPTTDEGFASLFAMTERGPAHFDRGKPFYPLVMHFLAMLYGFKELAARGIALRFREVKENLETKGQDMQDLIATLPSETPEATQSALEKMRDSPPPTEYLPPLDLASKAGRDRISVPADLISQELTDNATYISESLMRAAAILLILAWETTPGLHDQGPLWEFLRHCRNAAAHNGRFTFRSDEPRRKAEWSGIAITRELEGTLLFQVGEEPSLLGPADALHLLWDIEQTL